MKRYALLLLLAATASCHKDDPAPDDPLLGMWQATETHYYRYDGHGDISSDSVVSATKLAIRIERDSIKNYYDGNRVQVYKYKRTGDAIYIPVLYASEPAYNTWYVRSYTPTSFTKETNYPNYYHSSRQVTYYHR